MYMFKNDSLSLSPVGTVHFQSTTVVHGLLLLPELSNAFTNCHAIWYQTSLLLALAGVDLQQGPNALTDITATSGFHLTLRTVLQQTLHFGTIS